MVIIVDFKEVMDVKKRVNVIANASVCLIVSDSTGVSGG
jgi:hypothetical protein